MPKDNVLHLLSEFHAAAWLLRCRSDYYCDTTSGTNELVFRALSQAHLLAAVLTDRWLTTWLPNANKSS